jgi:hypothetical protein
MLRRWWTDKYKLPWTPSNVGDFTTLDLLTEFYEDLFEKNKDALYDASRGEDGEIMFESTGDPLIDKWEREMSMGIEPDLDEGRSPESKASSEASKKLIDSARKKAAQLDGIDDRFGGVKSSISPLDLLGKGK